MIDKSSLNWEGYFLLEEILSRHSDWIKYVENHPESKSLFNITIPCPTSGNPPICIDNLGDGPNVFFGPPHFDVYALSRIVPITWFKWFNKYNMQCADAIDIVVEKIMSEELIATYRKGVLGSCGFLNSEEFKNYLELDKIIKSVSWLGTYNHNYNGEWADPYAGNQNI